MTEDPKRWMDDESAPEGMRDFLAASQSKAPALPDTLREAVLRRVPAPKSRVVPFVVGGVLALAAAALIALAMNTSPVEPAVPPPTLEPEPLDAGPDARLDASTLEVIEVERVCGEEDVDYDCAVHIALPRTYEEVETRQAFGVAPPACRGGDPFEPDELTQVDATHFTLAAPHTYELQDAIRVCAYEHGVLVATGSIEGERSTPAVRVVSRYDRYDVFVSAERLDDDVQAVRLVRVPMEDFNGDGLVNGEDQAPAIDRIGCEGAEVAGWSAESFNRIASLRREQGEVALLTRAARSDEEATPVFIACVETARGSERAVQVNTGAWPEEEPMVLTPSGEVRVSSVRPLHQLLTLAEPDEAHPTRRWMRTNATPYRADWVTEAPQWVTAQSGRRVHLPSFATLDGSTVVWSDGTEEPIASRTPVEPGIEITDLDWSTYHPVFINGARVSLPWRGRDIERVEWSAPTAPEPVRAMPEEASGCLIASVLEVDAMPEGAERIGIAARRSTMTPGSRSAVACTEENLGVEMPAIDLVALPPDADGVRRIAFEFDATPPGLDDMGQESDCNAGYEIIACVRDEAGLHSLPGALGRWALSGPACFAADTPIATPNGHRPIASLESGMTVLAHDPETGARSETRVTRLIPRGERPILALALSNGETMHVTAEHPLFDAEASTFREAGSFEVGDVLRGLDGSRVRVLSTRETGESAPVFDLSVAGPHTYFANGVVAHNY
jgi:hypothetical protein